MKKTGLALAVISALLLSALAGTLPFGTVQAATNVTGILASDTTWTKANSPYTLTGNVLVSNGVTLTIEPGAIVNLGNYYIMVNGTLRARGTAAENVEFNSGSITFTNKSAKWNETIGSGSIIEKANLSSTNLSTLEAGPKIDSCSILGITVGGSSTVTNNIIANLVTVSGSPSISYNTIGGQVSVGSDANSPLISHNTISESVTVGYNAFSPMITDNNIMGSLTIDNQVTSALISHNSISGGMTVSATSATISFNNIVGGVLTSADQLLFLNNTLTGSSVGIDLTPKSPIGSINASIIDNTVTAGNVGIGIAGSMVVTFYGWYTDAYISGNIISGCSTAAIQVGGASAQGGHTPRYNNVTILDNLLYGNGYGIQHGGIGRVDGNAIVRNNFGVKGGDPIVDNIIANNSIGVIGGSIIEGNLIVNNGLGLDGGVQIRNNTIINNTVAIRGGFSSANYNNIYGNGLNINFTSSADGNATYNWWGTTDVAVINQTIYDYKNDFTLGRVNFIPLLPDMNSDAPSPETPVPVIPEFPSLTILPLLIGGTTLLALTCFKKRKR